MYEGLEFLVVGNDQNWVISFRCTIKRTPSWCDIIFGSFGSKLLPGCADFGVRLPVWQEICDMAISGFLRDRGASVLVDTSMLKPIETVKLPPTPKWYLIYCVNWKYGDTKCICVSVLVTNSLLQPHCWLVIGILFLDASGVAPDSFYEGFEWNRDCFVGSR